MNNNQHKGRGEENFILSLTIDSGSGGIANSLVSYSKALNLIDVRHKIILPKNAAVISELRSLENVDIYSFPRFYLKFLIFSRYLLANRIKKIFSSANVIFFHNAKLLKSQTHPDKTYVICHSGKFRYYQYAQNIIFLTAAAKQRYNELTSTRSNTAKQLIISHGFDIAHAIKQNKPINNKPIIVSGGRFVEKKRFQDLIKAASLLEKAHVDFELHIYGKGPLEKQLKDLMKTFHLQNVHVHDWAENLTEVFTCGDIFCLTSNEEPFGLILGEAMLCEMAVIATNTDGPLTMLGVEDTEKRGGYTYTCGDIEQLATKLNRLCQSPELRQSFGQHARQNIEKNFTLDVLAKNIQDLLENQ